jgi:hypothetical protein
MTTPAQVSPPSYGLLRAAEAITNWRALAMTCLAGVVSFLFFALTGWMMKSSVVVGGLLGIVSIVVWLIGYSSVGILLMRRAQGQEVGFMDAVLQAAFTVHRLFGVAVLLFLLFLGVALASLLILFVCRIPGLGPLLYSLVFPALAVILGVTIAAMFYVGFPLAAPAIWEGNTAFATIARLIGIVRSRLLQVITNLVILMLLVTFLSSVVFFVLLAGYSTAMGLSATAGIPTLGGMVGMFHGMMGGMGGMGAGLDYEGMGRAASYTSAFGFATGLLFTVGSIIPFLTFINGTCLVYLQAVDGLEFGETEQKLRDHVDEAKRRAQEARDRAQAKLNDSKLAMQSAPQADTPVAASRACVKCGAALAPDDTFCGECGEKNPA